VLSRGSTLKKCQILKMFMDVVTQQAQRPSVGINTEDRVWWSKVLHNMLTKISQYNCKMYTMLTFLNVVSVQSCDKKKNNNNTII